ncbi:MAG: two-component sensor histidine kinase [Defluviimonas sp.]|nr:two-component sensor histidine kinase [Defluviimonas sp.]
MSRLGLAGRLILLLALGLFSVQALGVVAYLADRRDEAAERPLLPYPDQIEAMVALFDSADAAERELLKRAFTDSEVELRIEPEAPQSDATSAAADLPLPGLADRLRDYSAVLGARGLQVAIPAAEAAGPLPRLRALLHPGRVRIAVALGDGNWLVVQRRRVTGLALAGLPLGMVSAILGFAVAGLAMLAVWRETRPLRELGSAATSFARSLRPVPMAPAGAPDLRRLIAAFNAMQDRIARLDRSRTDMIAALAHDVRTPLTRLRLRLRKLDPALQEAAGRDIDEIARVSDEAFRFAAADLAALERDVDLRALLGALAAEADVPLRDAAPGRAATLTGNADLLRRAFANLIANALHYGGNCRLTLAATPRRLVVTVEDDGPGIPPEDRARLLEPFERGEGSRSRATGGSGLGLALAERIVLRHGGTLDLGEATSGGLRVTVVLPVDQAV